MSVQTVSAVLSLLAILSLAAVALRVRALAHERRDYAPVQIGAYRIRAIGFWLLVLVGLPTSVWLFRANPYTVQAAAPQVVNATGYQWYWELDTSQVTAGRPVKFRVTSADVNHGFGLYDEAGTLVAQTQAMPGYINRLTHVFEAPGTYRVLCLEYCGLVHHNMIAEIP
ncbi:MAG: cytochrome c oxidase subunit II [Alphaproteobacteria bacterium]|nr:cytochrome c oxidase subunit II [Alphaproteobacteria bacterium]